MEIINDNEQQTSANTTTQAEATKFNQSAAIWGGIALIVGGALWLCHNYGLLSPVFFDHLFSWQSLVIICGLWLIATREYAWGAIISAVGVTFLIIDICGICISFTRLVLPILFMAAGVALIVTTLTRKAK